MMWASDWDAPSAQQPERAAAEAARAVRDALPPHGLEALPDAALLGVIELLSTGDVKALRLTSTRLCVLASRRLTGLTCTPLLSGAAPITLAGLPCVTRLDVNARNADCSHRLLAALRQHATLEHSVKHVRLSGREGLLAALQTLRLATPELTRLELRCPHGYRGRHAECAALGRVLAELGRPPAPAALTELHLQRLPLSSAQLRGLCAALPRLRSLSVRGLSAHLTCGSLAALRALTALTSLSVDHVRLTAGPFPCGAQLRVLELSDAAIAAPAFASLNDLTALTALALYGNGYRNALAFAPLPGLAALRRLHLELVLDAQVVAGLTACTALAALSAQGARVTAAAGASAASAVAAVAADGSGTEHALLAPAMLQLCSVTRLTLETLAPECAPLAAWLPGLQALALGEDDIRGGGVWRAVAAHPCLTSLRLGEGAGLPQCGDAGDGGGMAAHDEEAEEAEQHTWGHHDHAHVMPCHPMSSHHHHHHHHAHCGSMFAHRDLDRSAGSSASNGSCSASTSTSVSGGAARSSGRRGGRAAASAGGSGSGDDEGGSTGCSGSGSESEDGGGDWGGNRAHAASCMQTCREGEVDGEVDSETRARCSNSSAGGGETEASSVTLPAPAPEPAAAEATTAAASAQQQQQQQEEEEEAPVAAAPPPPPPQLPPRLARLRLDACERLMERHYAACAPLPSLTSLALHGCGGLTDKALMRVLRAAPGLTELSVRGAHHLTDAALAGLCGGAGGSSGGGGGEAVEGSGGEGSGAVGMVACAPAVRAAAAAAASAVPVHVPPCSACAAVAVATASPGERRGSSSGGGGDDSGDAGVERGGAREPSTAAAPRAAAVAAAGAPPRPAAGGQRPRGGMARSSSAAALAAAAASLGSAAAAAAVVTPPGALAAPAAATTTAVAGAAAAGAAGAGPVLLLPHALCVSPLRRLHLADVPRVTACGVAAAAADLQRLTELRLDGCRSVCREACVWLPQQLGRPSLAVVCEHDAVYEEG